ncbi:MAG: type II toxin-antitoxin system HipA family toxin [Acidiferrobacter sp.]
MMTSKPPSQALSATHFRVRALQVGTPQGPSGRLTKESRYIFNYHTPDDDAAVSLTMPIRHESYASGDLPGIFAMNRPEGYLRYLIEDRLKRWGVPSDLFLLLLAGRHQIGRLTYTLPDVEEPGDPGEHLADLLTSPSGPLFARLIDRYALRSGISGIQPKALVPLAREEISLPNHAALPLKTVIVKAEGIDYPGLARNEFFCLSVARAAGCDVPPFWLSEDGGLLFVARFDRREDGTALGFEDMAVLMGRTEQEKYQGSYEMIARAVEAYTGPDLVSARKLFERVALSCWMRDGDAHLKNFGLLYDRPNGPRWLAPIYDVVCTDIYPELDGLLALKMHKKKTFPSYTEIVRYGQRLGLSAPDVADVWARWEDAYDKTVTLFREDPRYQGDPLLTSLQEAIERPFR